MSWRRSAYLVLTTADPSKKAEAALSAEAEKKFRPRQAGDPIAPDRPARPPRPLLATPNSVPRRGLGSIEGRVALLHALAHIEFNAIDLAFDMALRFADDVHQLGEDASTFVLDWFRIGAEEARHFLMVETRLGALGSCYGALTAHGALWEAAETTSDNVLARLVIAPMVLEARGLDVTPEMARRLRIAKDPKSAIVLDRIFEDEIGHVGTGVRWFSRLCDASGLDPQPTFRRLVEERFRGKLKPPFNQAARAAAGMPDALYANWNEVCDDDQ